uniref:Uncharacterized protein n=1 Tax=Spironucleus salmonicida TaxID=348837 RepID=V6LB81_9EUKA|eukprot:EST41508.1 Hypothetical protein SS50377_19242 [Spironucleus salmonicida]
MTNPLSVDFAVHQYAICDGEVKVERNTQAMITFTIEGSEITQSSQLDMSCRYILRSAITTKEQLCAIQVVLLYKKLGKIAQNVQFQISQLKKIINSRDPKFWDNTGLVAAQMGLTVRSTRSTRNPDFAKFAQSIEDYHLQYFSLYNSFDTKKILYPEVIKDLNFHENQVLLQLAAIKYQTDGKYPLILPLIFGYSAFRLYYAQFTELKKNTRTRDVYGHKLVLLRKIFEVSNKIYNGESFIEVEQPQLDKFDLINLFQLPTHFLNTGICLFMFQQLCQVSYLFKAEYFALFSLVKNEIKENLTNAVISQSSKSGKSVALYTQYFFHLLMGNVPMLVNKEGSEDQQLYYYKTGSFHSQLEKQYKNTFKLQDLINFKETVLNDICDFHTFQLESLDHLQYLYRKMNIFIKNMYKDQSRINGVSGIRVIKHLKFNSSIQQQFDLLKQYSFFIYEGDVDTSGITDAQVLEYNYKHQGKKRPLMLIDECLDQQKQNYVKCTSLCQMIFGEYRQRLVNIGKYQYCAIVNILQKDQFQWFSDKDKSKKYTKHTFVYRVLSQLLHTDLLLAVKTELAEISASEEHRSLTLDCYQELQNIIKNIQTLRKHKQDKETEIYHQIYKNLRILTIYFSLLKVILTNVEYILIATEYLRLQTEEYDILDELIVYSPQILNVKNRRMFKNKFYLGLPKNYLDQKNYHEEFDVYFFRFILSLFDPRAVETLFWKTFQFIGFKTISTQNNKKLNNNYQNENDVVGKFWSFSVNEQMICYLDQAALPKQLVDQMELITTKNNKVLENRLNTTNTQVYASYRISTFSIIMVGTDIEIINESQIDKFSYYGSEEDYIYHYSANILGYVQPHPSLVHSAQYDKRSMLVNRDDMGTILDGIPKTLKKYLDKHSILVELLNSMMGEKSIGMQLICPYICPQIWYVPRKRQLQACNFNAVEKHVIHVNGNKNIVYQFSSLTQIVNYIVIRIICNESTRNEFEIYVNRQNIDLYASDGSCNLRSTASATLNQEVVVVLSYSLMCQFIETYSKVQLTSMEAQREFSSMTMLFKRSVLINYLSTILFIMIATQQSEMTIKNISLIIQQGESGDIGCQYLRQGNIATRNAEELMMSISRIPGKHEMMALTPTFDFAFQDLNNGVQRFSQNSVWNYVLEDSIGSAAEAFDILREQKTIDGGLIVAICFDKSMDLPPILEAAEMPFNFVLTFHGYGELGLERLHGCQVLPVHCGHHTKEVLEKMAIPFGIRDVVQIGQDQHEAITLVGMGKVADRFVTQQQTDERNTYMTEQKSISDSQITSYVYQIQNLDDNFQLNIKRLHTDYRLFKIIRYDCQYYIQIITKVGDKYTVVADLRNIRITLMPDQVPLHDFMKLCNSPSCKVRFSFECQSYNEQPSKVILDLALVPNLSKVNSQLHETSQMLIFIEQQNMKIIIIYAKYITLFQLLDFLELELVSVYTQSYDSVLTAIVQQRQNTDSMSIITLSEDKKHLNTTPKTLYASNQINMRLLEIDVEYQAELAVENIYPEIDWYNQMKTISVLYVNQKVPIMTSYRQLLSEIQDYQSVIYKIENDIIHLANENQYIGYIVDANRKMLTQMSSYEREYAYLVISLIQSQKVNLDHKFLFGQPFYMQFDAIKGLFKEINDRQGKLYQCQVEVHGELYTDQQRSYIEDKQFVTIGYGNYMYLSKLFIGIKVVATGIRHEENQDILQLIAIE